MEISIRDRDYETLKTQIQTLQAKRKVIDQCCITNNIDVLKWVFSQCNHIEKNKLLYTNDKNALKVAFEYGSVDICKWLYSIKYITNSETELFRISCGNGQLELSRWIRSLHQLDDTFAKKFILSCDKFGHNAFTYACIHGHLPTVRWLYSVIPKNYQALLLSERNYYVFRIICHYEHANVLKWLLITNGVHVNQKMIFANRNVFVRLVKKYRFELAKLIFSHTFGNFRVALSNTIIRYKKEYIKDGAAEMFKWYISIAGLIGLNWCFCESCEHGQLEIIKCIDNVCKFDKSLYYYGCKKACRGRHADVVYWILDNYLDYLDLDIVNGEFELIKRIWFRRWEHLTLYFD